MMMWLPSLICFDMILSMNDDNRMPTTAEDWEAKLYAELSEIKQRGWPLKRVKFTNAQINLIRACQHEGFKVRLGMLETASRRQADLKVIVKPKKQGTKTPWKLVNMNPRGDYEGDCTTRALAWVFREKWSYSQLRAMQEKISARSLSCGKTWRSAWIDIAHDEGWDAIVLKRYVQTAKIAELFHKGLLKHPVFVRTACHVAVVDDGVLVDSWDSRCKRVKQVLVKKEDFDVAKHALDSQHLVLAYH